MILNFEEFSMQSLKEDVLLPSTGIWVWIPYGNQVGRSLTKLKNMSEMWVYNVLTSKQPYQAKHIEVDVTCLILKAQISIGKLKLKWKNQESLYSFILGWGGGIYHCLMEQAEHYPYKKIRTVHLQSELRNSRTNWNEGTMVNVTNQKMTGMNSVSTWSQEDWHLCLMFSDQAGMVWQSVLISS